jgi:uncharacterized membrane protein (UPF0127 family)
MSFDKVLILLVLGSLLVSCSADDPSTQSCPPDDEPPSFGRTCSADGECDDYLVCSELTCGWPAAMTGEAGADTGSVQIERDGRLITEMPVELARSDLERRRGLAGRPCMQPGWAMLLVHPDEAELTYTIEEMRFAIDLVFAAADGAIVAVRSELEAGSPQLVGSGVAAKYVLELDGGEAREMGIEVGDRLMIGE